MSEGATPFRVLTVCTGNICRSPAAERLILHDWVDGAPGIEVLSAGARAMVGEPIYITMAHLLEQSGAYSGEFSAQSLSPDLVGSADLVLGMTRRHRAEVAATNPAATPRAFTLREFARLVAEGAPQFEPSQDRADSLRRLVDIASAHRRAVTEPEADDIADPYGRDLDAYYTAFDEISQAVRLVGRVLRGEPPEQSDDPPSDSGDHAPDVSRERRRGRRR